MAEQEEPVRRRVALKVIKLGMDTKQVIARFEAERQALALMDHPNIAKILEAGVAGSSADFPVGESASLARQKRTDSAAAQAGWKTGVTGRPYFVMELVRGIKITDYCDQNNLPTQKRLELFIQVCKAVQHAHQKGIIHRDLKPSNILVTLHDGVPVPKVIDFGIAKATEQRLTDKTVFTAFDQFIGTPAYMSSEQAEMSGLDIDTRSDIYSLGVLLYELLTSRIPFDPKELAAAGLDEMRRIIREKDPVRPSTKLSGLTAADQTTVARQRQLEAAKLVHLVRGDLDWIVMKCLEKDRTRRYETANGLARDIERHLENEPVVACPPSRLYRFQKMVRRNKVVFAAVVSVIGALFVGLGLSTILFLRESKARRTAAEQGARSQQLSELLSKMLRSVGPSRAKGRDTQMVREILDETALGLEKGPKIHPAVECELRRILGRTYQDLGEYTNAVAMAKKAVRNSELLFVDGLPTADALTELGAYQANLGDWTGAEASHTRALAIRRKLLAKEHTDVAQSLMNVGIVQVSQGKYQAGEEMLRAALSMTEKLAVGENLQTLRLLNMLGITLRRQGKHEEAEKFANKALTTSKKLFGEDNLEMITALNGLATIQIELNDLRNAEANLNQALGIARKLSLEAHPYVATILANLSAVLQSAGKLEEAERIGVEALAMDRQRFGNKDHRVAGSLVNLGVLLQYNNKLEAAEANLQEAVTILQQLPNHDPRDLASALLGLGDVLRQRGKPEEALRVHLEALKIENALPQSPAQRARLAISLTSLALTQLALTNVVEAERFARDSLTLREQEGDPNWELFYTRSLLGETLAAQGRYKEAEDLVVSGYQGMKDRKDKLPFDGKVCFRLAGQRVTRLYEDWGKPDKATEWCTRLAADLGTESP